MKNIAGCIFSFDRPNYLSKVIKSLEKQTIDIDWYAYQDNYKTKNGKINADSKDINKCLEILDSSSLDIYINVQEYNVGIGRQKLDSYELFDDYDKVIFYEDDMVVSKYYNKLLIKMSEQFPKSIVYAPDRPRKYLQEYNPNEHLNCVKKMWKHYWGYLQPKYVTEKVKPYLEKYCEVVGDDYHIRPSKKIRNVFNVSNTSHDAIMDKALRKENLYKICTVWPRGEYIGKEGMHMNPKIYKKWNMEDELKYEFEEDKNIEEFELIE